MYRSTSFLCVLALVIGFTLFKVKYEVIEIEDKFLKIHAQIKQEQKNIHILKAEWSHLNEPQRLQVLAKKYLDISPTKIQQVVALLDTTSPSLSFFDDPLLHKGARQHLASQKEVR